MRGRLRAQPASTGRSRSDGSSASPSRRPVRPRGVAPAPDTGRRVAVIGAGPAGLACAAELRRRGVGVTRLSTRASAPAASADHGIVPWRLPRETVACDVAAIERAGVGDPARHAGPGGGRRAPARGPRRGRPRDRAGHGRGRWASRARTSPGVVDALDVIGRAIAGGGRARGRATRRGHRRRQHRLRRRSGRRSAWAPQEVTLYYRRSAEECPAYPHAIELVREPGRHDPLADGAGRDRRRRRRSGPSSSRR